ncbi:MAG: recombination-associated protein RdgC [Myxococcota bacterium]
MGAISGTLSYKLFHVQGDLPRNWKERYVEAVNQHAFEELTPDNEDEESMGWVVIDRPLQTEVDLYSMLFDHFINLSLRHDRYVVPSALLNAHVTEAEREYLRENEKKKLSKFEQEDIKEMVKRRLKEQQLPRMRIIDMSWDIRAGRVRFWSQSNKMCELFQGFFQDTFGPKLLPGNPYINAVELGLDTDKVETLQGVEPTNFVTTPFSDR